MSWNYRIFLCRHKDKKTGEIEKWLEIKEAYYKTNGDPDPEKWTQGPATVHADDNIVSVLEMMYEAITKPVIDDQTGKPIGMHMEVAARLKEEREYENSRTTEGRSHPGKRQPVAVGGRRRGSV